MRWDDLFDDLEGQFASAKGAEFLSDVGELTIAERASVEFAARLKAAGSRTVAVRLEGGTIVRGVVVDATATWARMREGSRDHLVPLRSIVGVTGLSDRSLPLKEVERRLSLGYALRILKEGRVRVVVEARGVEYGGIVAAVGSDHLDLLEAGSNTVVVPFVALTRVTSA